MYTIGVDIGWNNSLFIDREVRKSKMFRTTDKFAHMCLTGKNNRLGCVVVYRHGTAINYCMCQGNVLYHSPLNLLEGLGCMCGWVGVHVSYIILSIMDTWL